MTIFEVLRQQEISKMKWFSSEDALVVRKIKVNNTKK